MRKRLVGYRKRIDALLIAGADAHDIDSVLEEHLVQISFFQHERIVHLHVTLAFAIMTVLSAMGAITTLNPLVGVLTLLFLVLLVPYIVHYYFLENETQKLYAQYDQLLELSRAKKTEHTGAITRETQGSTERNAASEEA